MRGAAQRCKLPYKPVPSRHSRRYLQHAAADAMLCADVRQALKKSHMVPLRPQVRSVPGELSTDTNAVLRLAQASGHVAKPQLIQVSAASLGFLHKAIAK